MLFEHLFRHAQAQPQKIAFHDDRGAYTYQQIAAMAAGLGMYLKMQTQKPRVGLLLPTSAGFAASFYGALLAGKGVVPINFLLGDREIAHIIQDSDIDTVVTIPQLAARLQNTPLKLVDLTQLPQTPPAAITPQFPHPAPDDVAVLIYTSGTSGLPKGVQLTYHNLQSCVAACIEYAQLKGQHTFLGIVPLFHSLGLTATLLAPIELGATTYYMARFSPVGALEKIREHKISLVFGVPSMFGAMLKLKNLSPEDFPGIYAIISGGEPLPEAIRVGFEQRTGQYIHEGYGLSETCGPIAFNAPHSRRAGSVGRLLPGASARFVDDDGRDVPSGQPGEIWLKGPMIMRGYHNLPEATAEVLTADGYFKTGDIGCQDADGFLRITGRKKEMISIAGEKAAPREIEDLLVSHPAIAEAAVIGRKDPSRGEMIVAFVIPREGHDTPDPDALREFCRQQGLPNWKCPREIRIAEELPRSPTGKILKRLLAEKLDA